MQLTTKVFFKNPIIFFLILINFIIPPCLYKIGPSAIIRLLTLWDKFIGVPVFLLCIITIAGMRKKAFVGDVIAYYGYKMIATILVTLIISGTITGGGAFRHLRQLSAICYIALALRINYKSTVKILAYCLSVLVVLNFLTILLFPNGLYYDGNWENYFLGYDNGHIVVFMPALFFAYEYAFLKKKYLLMIITWVSVFVSAFITRSGVTMGGLAALAGLLVVVRFPAVRRYLFNWKTVLIGIGFVFIFIVILRKQADYQDLIFRYFGKDSTLTDRTVLWDRAFYYIRENPWLGTGDNQSINLNMFMLRTQKLSYSHNEILDVLVRSGMIGLLLYCTCIIRTFALTRKKKDEHLKIWLVFMAAYWFMMLFESYSNYSFYYLYFVMLIAPRYMIVTEKQFCSKKMKIMLNNAIGFGF